jgi:hypothetical protein
MISKTLCTSALKKTFCLNYCILCLKSLHTKAPRHEPMTSGETFKKNMQKYKQNGINWYCFCFLLDNLKQNAGHVKSSKDRKLLTL